MIKEHLPMKQHPNKNETFVENTEIRTALERIYNQYGNNLDLFFQDVKKDLARQHKKLETSKSLVA
jgi:hypothetical protein